MSSISYLNDLQANTEKNSNSKDIIGLSFPLPDQKGSRCFRFFNLNN